MSTQPMPDPQVSGDVGEIMEQDWNAFKGAIRQLFAKWGMKVLDISYAHTSDQLDGYEIIAGIGDNSEPIFMLNPNWVGAEKYVFGESDKWTEILDRVDGLYQDYLKIVGHD